MANAMLKRLQEEVKQYESRESLIRESAAECAELRSQADVDKKRASASEAAWKDAVFHHFKMVSEEHPLFDNLEKEKKAKANGHAKNGTAAPTKPDAWRSWPLEQIPGIPKGALAKLQDGDCKKDLGPVSLKTLGELQDWIAARSKENWQDPLTLVKGIGAEAGTKITDAIADVWKQHPEWTDADKQQAAAAIVKDVANGTKPPTGTAAEASKLHDQAPVGKEVALGSGLKLHVTRTLTTPGGDEEITGHVANAKAFGDWCNPAPGATLHPNPQDICAAVSKSLKFKVQLVEHDGGMDIDEKANTITLHFERAEAKSKGRKAK